MNHSRVTYACGILAAMLLFGTTAAAASKPPPESLRTVIVRLADPSLAAHAAETAGGPGRLDASSPASLAHLSLLRQRQEEFVSTAQAVVPGAVFVQSYRTVFNGVALALPNGDASGLAGLPGVIAVYPDALQHPDTDDSPSYTGATTLWPKLGGQGQAGQGVVVGVIDTGIWPEHPSFSDPDPGGKSYAAPPATWSGSTCDFGNTAHNPDDALFTCNNKLLAAARFMASHDLTYPPGPTDFVSARDSDGHGTHTASTAAGSRAVASAILGRSFGTLSGIAPRAHVAMYKACGSAGCFNSDLVAAVDQAVADGVDVINYSISGGISPYDDPVELAFLDAYAAGVFVSASAGNAGTTDSVNHRGPWVTTVAATVRDREMRGSISMSSTSAGTESFAGSSVTPALASTPVVMAGGDGLCMPGMPAVSPTGAIVVCDRGTISRSDKSLNAMNAGAGGVILRNMFAGQSTAADTHWVPTVHVDYEQGQLIGAYVSGNTVVTASLSAGTQAFAPALHDVLGDFSSRGGPGQSLGVSKPDLGAPGVQVLAGYSPFGSGPSGELFQVLNGTSMAAPHVAGAAALLRDLKPGWSPGRIKSALMTSAAGGVRKPDGVTPADPFDVGSGRINLRRASSPGLTFTATRQAFIDNEDELWRVNGPSVYIPSLPGGVKVRRTAYSELGHSSSWRRSVTRSHTDFSVRLPRVIRVGARKSRGFTIAVDAARVPVGEARHAVITLRGLNRDRRIVVRIPVSFVRGESGGLFVGKSCEPPDFSVGAVTSCAIRLENVLDQRIRVTARDVLPGRLRLLEGSVRRAKVSGNGVKYSGWLPASTISLDTSFVAPFGYQALSTYYSPIAGFGDDTYAHFVSDPFKYGGRTYDTISVASNGFVVAGGTSSSFSDFIPQDLPSAADPNNVIAPFWTDLNPAAGGDIYIGYLVDPPTSRSWLVVDWVNVPAWGTTDYYTFQVWLRVNGEEEVFFVYDRVDAAGSGFGLRVGAENSAGLVGATLLSVPAAGDDLEVINDTASRTIRFRARGRSAGPWKNCVRVTDSVSPFTAVSCDEGSVTP